MQNASADNNNNNKKIPTNSNHGNMHPILVLCYDVSHMASSSQFLLCACGAFSFSLLCVYLQELISVHSCNPQFGLFLSMEQFSGHVFWSNFLRNIVERRKTQTCKKCNNNVIAPQGSNALIDMHVGASLLRALYLGMNNLAMQHINYPIKTLLKSLRVFCTMPFVHLSLS